jgi:hypothetical protein
MLTVIESAKDIHDALPYSELLRHRFQLAGTTQITVITRVQDYLSLHAKTCPFDGFVYECEYQVFIGIAVSSNSGVRETLIPRALVLSDELSFLKGFIDE